MAATSSTSSTSIALTPRFEISSRGTNNAGCGLARIALQILGIKAHRIAGIIGVVFRNPGKPFFRTTPTRSTLRHGFCVFPFRKVDPAWVRIVRQNHRIIDSDVCNPAHTRNVRRRPVQVAKPARSREFVSPPSTQYRFTAGPCVYRKPRSVLSSAPFQCLSGECQSKLGATGRYWGIKRNGSPTFP
jgi:hypothetical protein